MQTKYIPLLRHLFEASTWVTASSLSDALGISKRTVKNYIKELNSSYQGIILSSSKGYLINAEIGAKALQETRNSIPQTARDRTAYIIRKISLEPVSSFDLCEDLFISSSTLQALIPRIKDKLENFDLNLRTTSGNFWIEGLEKNKRKLLSQLLYQESNKNFVNLNTIQFNFPDIDVIYIKNVVLEILNEYHYFINDYSLSNLVLHIAIAADRIRNFFGQWEYGDMNTQSHVLPHEHEMASKVVKHLEEHFQLKFSPEETQEITLLLVSRATSLNFNSITVDNLATIIGKDCLDLVYEMVNAVGSFYYINLNEPEFLIRFALHIKNLLIRAQNKYFCKNPIGNTLKASCPLIYENAIVCSSIIKERLGISISDDEIGYIAFHLGSALETQKELASKLTALIYCPTYYNMDNRLYNVLSSRFSTELMIANVVTDEADLKKNSKYDFIITTAPVNRLLPTPYIQVQPFLSETDINSIRQKLTECRTAKKKKGFDSHLRQILMPEFFECGKGFEGKAAAIHYLCGKLAEKGYVEPSFEDEVLEREEMSSTGFQNFAIPHAMKMRAHKTGMYIYLSDEPIDWGETQASLIILMCFNRDERYIFNEIFEPLTMILTEPANLKKALTITEYEKFISFLSDCL